MRRASRPVGRLGSTAARSSSRAASAAAASAGGSSAGSSCASASTKRTSRRAAPLRRSGGSCLHVGEPRADGQHALAREDQRALDEGLDHLDVHRLHAVPEDQVAGGERHPPRALAHLLHAAAHVLEAHDLLAALAHQRLAPVAEEGRGRAVHQRQLAEAPPRDLAVERARRAIGGAHVEGQVGGGEDLAPGPEPARAGNAAKPPALRCGVRGPVDRHSTPPSSARMLDRCARTPVPYDRCAVGPGDTVKLPRRLLLVLPAAACLAAIAPGASAADQGIRVIASKQLSPRLTELTLATPALAVPTHVRILVPAGYDATPARVTRCSTCSTVRSTTTAPGPTRAPPRRSPPACRRSWSCPTAARAAGTRTGSGRARPTGRPSTSASCCRGSTPTTARSRPAASGPSPASRWAASARSATRPGIPTCSPGRRASPARSTS